MPTRPAWYRRRGPDGPSPLQPVLDGAARVANRVLRSGRAPTVIAAAAVPVTVGLIAARKRHRHAPGA